MLDAATCQPVKCWCEKSPISLQSRLATAKVSRWLQSSRKSLPYAGQGPCWKVMMVLRRVIMDVVKSNNGVKEQPFLPN